MGVTKRIIAFGAAVSLLLIPYATLFATPTQAAVSNWQRGATLVPQSPGDFGSPSFDQSLQNLHNTGANAVALVVPYYQSNTGSTDIAPGWNTPTDTSLGAAIDYAHSLGMSVTIKMLVDPYDGSWRAYINPSDRNTWFGAYQYYLVHLGTIAQQHHAEMIDIGTELVDMSADTLNPTNTQHWVTMIAALRAVYSGKLTYGANSEDASQSPYTDEKRFIGFWPELDYVGFSAYYNLTYNGSVSSLEGSWDYWNKNDIQSFETQVGKPILLMEVGYESTSGTSEQPWNWSLNNGYNGQEQADDYQALLSYWNNYSYVQGVYFWDWSTNPSAGGSGDTTYTPQNKPAQQILTQWFGNPTPPSQTSTSTQTGGNQPASNFSSSAAVNPNSPVAATPASVAATLTSTSAINNELVDVEVYDGAGNKVAQQFYPNQSLSAGQSQTYTFNWTPQSAGSYSVVVGVFSNDWTQNYYWNATAGSATVSAASTQNSGGNSGSGSSTGGSFTMSGSVSPATVGQPATVSASVTDTNAGSALVDLEVYNQSGSKVFQQFYDNEAFSAGQTKNYSTQWTPNAAGNYQLAVGVFAPGWAQTYAWNGDAANSSVGSGSNSGNTPPVNPPPQNPPPSSSSASVDQNGESVRAGSILNFTGRNFDHEQNVIVTLNGTVVAGAHADGGGNFSTGSLEAPKTPGTYTYKFSDAGGASASATVTVTQ